jgi:hypothetical protein
VKASTRRELTAFALALFALVGALMLLEYARRRGDSRRSIAQAIAREGSRKDLLIVLDEAPELVALARPVPAVWGLPTLGDLSGIRRLYGLASTEAPLGHLFARLGPAEPFRGEARARRWDITARHLSRVVFNANDVLGTQLQARREGGVDDGPCPFVDGHLTCHGPPWNHVMVDAHHFDGIELRCVYGHPQADGRLILELTSIPPARAVVGAVGIDDGGYHPTGADVTAHVEYRAEESPPVVADVVARNRRGLTPWRIEVPERVASATITITTPNAGARQFCFTFLATQ